MKTKFLNVTGLCLAMAASLTFASPESAAETCVLDTDADGNADGTSGANDNGGDDDRLACGAGA
ncbi:MAG: hypothetical protein AAFY43_11190, partial [Pseudomonadota bacterium]